MLDNSALRLTENLIRQKTNVPSEVVPLVVVQHIRDDAATFLAALNAAKWRIASCIAIPYSSEPAAVRRLLELGINVLRPGLKDLPECLETEIRRAHERFGQRVVVHEVGGYLADVLTRHPAIAEYVSASVEETKQGLWRYSELPNLQIPVAQIADSPLKKIEARYVGSAVALSTLELLRGIGIEAIGMKAAVIGYGDIGAACARTVGGLGNLVSIYDTDMIRMISARADGFTAAIPADLIKSCSIIIGCTGSDSVDPAWFTDASGHFYLSSGSSRAIEFARLRSLAGDSPDPMLSTRYGPVPCTIVDVGSAHITILNSGMPVNFLSGSLPYSMGDLVFAQIFYALLMVIDGDLPPGMHPLPERVLSEIANSWYGYYGQPFGSHE